MGRLRWLRGCACPSASAVPTAPCCVAASTNLHPGTDLRCRMLQRTTRGDCKAVASVLFMETDVIATVAECDTGDTMRRMHPTAELAQTRRAFFERGSVAAVDLPKTILRSWQRCRRLGLPE